MFSLENAAAPQENLPARDSPPMNPEFGSSPRTNKGAFFIADGFLLLVAFLISWTWDSDTPAVFAAIIACVLLAAVIGVLPFILDWVAAQREAGQAREAQLAAQVARLEAASEALTRAAAQVHAVESAVHKAAKDAENLPYRMQEKLAEFNEALAEKEDEQRAALEQELAELRAAHGEQLKAAAAKIKETVGELSAFEKNARIQVAAAHEAATKLAAAGSDAATRIDASLQSALARLADRLAALERTAAAPAEKPTRRPPNEESASPFPMTEPAAPPPVAAVMLTESVPPFPMPELEKAIKASADPFPTTTTEGAAPAEPPAAASASAPTESAGIELPKPRRSRTPRKPKPEEVMAAMSGDAPVAVESAPPVEAPARDLSTEATPRAESSVSSDGSTRLLATAYIGIGNKLFIRGDGPGLSWDAGVPMQFVSIGKWGWSTHEATGPVTIRLYKNDETPALSGEVVLDPGKHTEVTALF